ncbi:MAG: UDP-N-acetylmuramoyl-L-alanine--D-glutamate ligase [Syntrophaceae bacterium]
MDLAGKRVLVIGLGKTGLATVRFLLERGAKAVVTDEKPPRELAAALADVSGGDNGVEVKEYSPASLARIDLVVPSPGVPPSNPLLKEAVRRGIPVLSEIEVAFRFLKRPAIAITGTNGKTTTTTLVGELLRGCGKTVFVGGNIGTPLIESVNGPQPYDYAVLEISSFQLQWVDYFRPAVSVLLNTTIDHLDYHGTFDEYRAAKERIFENQQAGDIAILNADDPFALPLLGSLEADVQCFSSSAKLRRGIFLDNGRIRLATDQCDEEYPLEMIRIPGVHNIENVMAAVLMARSCGCSREKIIKVTENFRGVSHRIEFAADKGGVLFYDDSKGTNVGAVIRALESFPGRVILMLGGRDKGGDFENLIDLIRKKVKRIVLFGEAGQKINSIIGGIVETSVSATLREAVSVAYDGASPGDIVLLSPGCTSFDEFTSYAERGRLFQEWVKAL